LQPSGGNANNGERIEASMTKPNPAAAAAKLPANPQEAQIDRLIALASEPAQLAKREEATALAGVQDSGQKSMWKSLSQLKGVLPYVSKLLPLLDARFLPLLELLGAGHGQGAALTKEMHEGLLSLQTAQRELVAAVREQTLDVKALEDQIVQLRENYERNLQDQEVLARDMRSMGSLIRAVGAGLAVLLVIVILMLGALLARSAR
jgi:hypothetical protein